jgi:type II secretory pathway component GspD/PulD (secretin)
MLAGMVAGALCPLAQAQDGKGLDAVVPTLSVSNIDIREVLILLSGYSGLNFTTSQAVKGGVTVELSDVTVRDVLDVVLKDNGFNYIETPGGIIRVMTQKEYLEQTTEAVDVKNRRYIPRYVTVDDLQNAFRPLLSKNGKITVVKPTNTVIVADVDEVLAKIDEMYPLVDQQQLTRVFRLEYTSADDIQKQLEAAMEIKRGQIMVDKERNILILTTTPENLEKAAKIIEEFDFKLKMEVFQIQFNDPEEIAKLLKPILSKDGYLEMNEQTSTIIVRDIPSRVDEARELIEKLDRPPQAVWIEAEIINVSVGKDLELGANWRLGRDVAPFAMDATTSGVLKKDEKEFINAFTGLLNGNLSFYDFSDWGASNIAVAINAVEKNNMGNVISSPRVLVMNDEEADFNVGAEEPFSVRQQYTTSAGDRDIFTQRTRRVGITLTVTPHIIPAGYVKMDLAMEDSGADRVDIGNGDVGLRVNQRTLKSVVLVKDGRTVGVGGLISRNESQSQNGGPFISSIPVLGLPFRNTTKSNSRQKLLLFLTPHIIDVDDPYFKYQIDDSMKNRMYQKDGVFTWEDKKETGDKDNPDRWFQDLPREEQEIYLPGDERQKAPVLTPGNYDEKGVFWTPGAPLEETPAYDQPASLETDDAPKEDGGVS